MNRLAYIFLIILLTSCNYFEKQKVNSEDLLEEELQTFNWNDVDTYPTFDSCNSITAKQESKMCFQNSILFHVNDFLGRQKIVVSEDVNDTIRLKLIIDNNGRLEIEHISIKPETQNQIPHIDSLLRQSLKGIPRIYPAIKRGQQVTTAFELPVIVRID
ncbi:hypothetical protein [Winogradskyella sp.]|jgi:PBP1b-binding outer membrane lipoprotein LpoB|uniref:hypothetical protein n=1 Tax=Winogradskyella sp. TaxID=1883156 RepID=UPI0025DBBF90|nr:hypothetical protein [Winogradskyella sp.]MCT4630134.1 hypothetical protein [Winogradskyella sp.]